MSEEQKIQNIANVLESVKHEYSALLRRVDEFCRNPTERNDCYFVGYLAASSDLSGLSEDAYTVLLAASGEPSLLQEALKRVNAGRES